MREILFRGKRVDNGEWVKGDPAGSIRGAVSKIDYFDGLTDCETVDVIPSTVGQFTGLTDKNGNKIFEGDILKAKWRCLNNVDTVVGVVQYDNAAFFLETDDYYLFFESNIFSGECEVIGNIHDTPELLEVSNE